MSRAQARIGVLLVVIIAFTGIGVAGEQITSASSNRTEPSSAAGGRLPIQGEGGTEASQSDLSNDLIQVLERDAIQSLDNPPVVSASSSSASSLNPDDEVIGVISGELARAYPLRILASHEIVNDVLDGIPIAVTFCPLCYSGVVYDRRVAGEERSFGVSGILLNSDLVLYDRERENLWVQVTGEAISGPDRGSMLRRVAFVQTNWTDWLAAHPASTVLDIVALGGTEQYPAERFDAYYSSGQTGLVPIRGREDIAPKSLVIGVRMDGNAFAWPMEPLAGDLIVSAAQQDFLAVVIDSSGRSGRVFRLPEEGLASTLNVDANDQTTLIDQASGRRWSSLSGAAAGNGPDLVLLESTVSFWFAWSVFYPETILFEIS